MTYEALIKYVEHELQWLKYYALREDREKLNQDSNLYSDLRSIGYTKRVIPLDRRCPATMLTSTTPIDNDLDLDGVYEVAELRDWIKNKYTPLEVFWIKYPEKRIDVLEKLK